VIEKHKNPQENFETMARYLETLFVIFDHGETDRTFEAGHIATLLAPINSAMWQFNEEHFGQK
jgi:hypothetical protein